MANKTSPLSVMKVIVSANSACKPASVHAAEKILRAMPDDEVLTVDALVERIGISGQRLMCVMKYIDESLTTKCLYNGQIRRVFGNPRSIAKINHALKRKDR
ncbi:MAG: hypothetical protein N3A66_04420 [Planctomycetota bacterium]|nr:hypothetical protein [Planctomycetota bacterium]